MNLILFEADEVNRPLALQDPRAIHLLQVLRRSPGDAFDAGRINGPRGKGMIKAIERDAIELTFRWDAEDAQPECITLVVGLTRPQTARDVLRDATTIGVAAIHFASTEKTDPNYAQSSLWKSGEWRRHVIHGAEQAFVTTLPVVTQPGELHSTLTSLPPSSNRLALDNYEADRSLAQAPVAGEAPSVLAVGPERGWSARERALLREHGFALVHLGGRVLRTETACIAGLTLLRARLGLFNSR